jgi:hypothetical protein
MSHSVGGIALALRGVFLPFAAVAFCACGSKLGEVADGSPDRSGDAAAVDGGGNVDGGGGADYPITGSGTLILQAFGGPSGSVAAQVPLVEPGVGPSQTCAAPLEAGACQLTSCQMGGIGSPRQGDGNFGPMSASVGTTTVPITYNRVGYPTVYFPSSVTLEAGGTMMFHGGNGASVPFFDLAATIPGLAVITSPVATTDGGAATIDTSQDLSVTWSPISIGQVRFHLDGGSWTIGGVAISVTCTFDGASGSGVVPRTLLSSLKATSATDPTYAGLSSGLDDTIVIDGLTIVTQSFQNSPVTAHDFEVTLQ